MKLRDRANYGEVTYPRLLDNGLARWLWRRVFCRAGWHLLDAVWTIDREYLHCDACRLEVVVARIDRTHQR